MVQHHANHHSGNGSNGGNGANSIARKASPDNNNNNQQQQHTFTHYNYTQPLIDDYNNDTPAMRSSLIYMYAPHNAAISVATSSLSAQQQNSVSSTHVVTTASTIDEVIADTLKDEHNGNSVSVNGGNSVNSNEDETAHYLSLTSANELPERWVPEFSFTPLSKLPRDFHSIVWNTDEQNIVRWIAPKKIALTNPEARWICE